MYTLSIEDTVEVPVKFTLKQGKVNKIFSFTVTADRQAQEVVDGWVSENDRKVKDILAEVVSGWSGQTLVMDGDKPAEFNPESFSAMLSVPGVAMRVYVAYLKECGAKEKN